ncbi:hypothetical protein [Clostridium sp. YIM B02555]|uniref:hypothetical protein n=1 Tax=Clostridium sp. YIM B02555 TaxID=2911968 RepID=UPI001EEE9A59|nr:hypothetical protein [Clostridium sp. YIM B02555]
MEEALVTNEQQKLQPAAFGKDSSKWTTTNIEKLTKPEKLGGFTNDTVLPGTTECIVKFELNPEYYEYIQKTAVPQRGSKKSPNIKFHHEGFENKKEGINYGITPQELDKFNDKNNLINVEIVEGTTKTK